MMKVNISTIGIVAILLITLKLTNEIVWDWMWVLLPLWILPAIFICLAVFGIVFVAITFAVDKFKQNKRYKGD